MQFRFGKRRAVAIDEHSGEGAHLPPAGTPPQLLPGTGARWFEIQGSVVVERNRCFLISLGLLGVLLVLCLALLGMLPLKTVVPFVLEKTDEGAVWPAPRVARNFQPGDPEKRYFIAQWVRNLLTLDAHLTEQSLADAYRLTRGKATVEFTDWIKRMQPLKVLKQDPTLTRTVSISSVSLIQDQVALVRVVTESRNVGNPLARREKFILTLDFSTVPPRTEEEVLANPVGLFVTHFLVNDDLEK